MGRLLMVLVLIGVYVVCGAWQSNDYDGDQTVRDCINSFVRLNIDNENLNCLLFRPYLKCIIKVTKLYKFPAALYKYNYQMNDLVRRADFNCQFDIEAISAEIAREQHFRAIPVAAIDMEGNGEEFGREQRLSKHRSWIQN